MDRAPTNPSDKAKENLITVITRHVIIESGINKSEKYSLFERDCETVYVNFFYYKG